MKQDMVMPKMGESITEGTIIRWLKKVGDTVDKDEIILEISTDKVDSEIPTPIAGTIVEILASEGDTVEVGKVIARIDSEGKSAEREHIKGGRNRSKSNRDRREGRENNREAGEEKGKVDHRQWDRRSRSTKRVWKDSIKTNKDTANNPGSNGTKRGLKPGRFIKIPWLYSKNNTERYP